MAAKDKEKGDRLWFRIVLFLVPRMVTLYFRFVDLTSRKVYVNERFLTELNDQPFELTALHGAMLFPIYRFRKTRGIIMVSRSFDGEIIARTLERMGYETVRGSSSRGGHEALHGMVKRLNVRKCHAGIAVDAPRGPAGTVKMGAVMIARDTGLPMLPFVSYSTRAVHFNSWDQMSLPLPFGSIVSVIKQSIMAPQGLSSDEYEHIRIYLETALQEALIEAKQKVAAMKGKS